MIETRGASGRFARLVSFPLPLARHSAEGREVLSVETQPDVQAVSNPRSPEPTQVTITERASRPLLSGRQNESGPSRNVGWEHRVEAVEARIEHLEAELEGLQDAVHRRAILEDDSIGELRKRTEPDQIARDLSRDARSRGL